MWKRPHRAKRKQTSTNNRLGLSGIMMFVAANHNVISATYNARSVIVAMFEVDGVFIASGDRACGSHCLRNQGGVLLQTF